MSQAIWTPDGKAIAKHMGNILDPKPNLYRWTESQYTSGGPFDKWLRTVETCNTRIICCGLSGLANIVIRDFPTPEFSSAVINKNFKMSPGQFECEQNELAKEEAARIAEAERQAEKRRQAEALRKAAEEKKRIAAIKAKVRFKLSLYS